MPVNDVTFLIDPEVVSISKIYLQNDLIGYDCGYLGQTVYLPLLVLFLLV